MPPMQVKAERHEMLEQQQQVQRMQGQVRRADEEVVGAYEDGGVAEGAAGGSPALDRSSVS